MAGNEPLTPVVLAAADLKRASPEYYDVFVKAMKAYADRTLKDYLASDANGILGAQGKAQVLDQLAGKLENCFQLETGIRTRT